MRKLAEDEVAKIKERVDKWVRRVEEARKAVKEELEEIRKKALPKRKKIVFSSEGRITVYPVEE